MRAGVFSAGTPCTSEKDPPENAVDGAKGAKVPYALSHVYLSQPEWADTARARKARSGNACEFLIRLFFVSSLTAHTALFRLPFILAATS